MEFCIVLVVEFNDFCHAFCVSGFCFSRRNLLLLLCDNYFFIGESLESTLMGKILYFLCFILSVFPTDVNENRRHVHVIRRGSKKSHKGDTVAKIWIEEDGIKNISVAWSELSTSEELEIVNIIENNYDAITENIDRIFRGEKVDIMKINKK